MMKRKMQISLILGFFIIAFLFHCSRKIYATEEESFSALFILCSPTGQMRDIRLFQTTIKPMIIQNLDMPFNPPVLIHSTYWLDEKETAWEDILGQKGVLRAEIVLINQKYEVNARQLVPYLVQAQVPLDLRKVELIDAFMGDKMTIGYMQTLSYAGMLQNTMEISWEAFSDSWEQQSIQLILLPKMLDIPLPDIEKPLMLQIKALMEMDRGLQQMMEGMNLMEKSTKELQIGFIEYQQGFRQWSLGFQELHQKLPLMIKAFDDILAELGPSNLKIRLMLSEMLEAGKTFENLKKDLEQTQLSLIQINLLMFQWTHDNEKMLQISTQTSDESIQLRTMCTEIQNEYSKDTLPWQLAEKVKENLELQNEWSVLLHEQTRSINFIKTFFESMQKKINDEYLPIIVHAQNSYHELLNDMEQFNSGILDLTNELGKGKQGAIDAANGSQHLFEGLKALQYGRIALSNGIKDLASSPRLIIYDLGDMRNLGIQRMIKEAKINMQNLREERHRINVLKSLAEVSKNQAIIIKIEYPTLSVQRSILEDFSNAADQKTVFSLTERLKAWIQSFLMYFTINSFSP